MPYWKVKNSLSICNDLLLFNNRIVVPKDMRKETLNKIHVGHQGIERCHKRAMSSVWWPGISGQISQMVRNCQSCIKDSIQRRELLLPTMLPGYPWKMIGMDLFELSGVHYFVV